MRILSWSVQKLNGNPAGLRQSLILPTGETAFFKDHSRSSTMHSGLFSVLSAMWSVGTGSSFTLRSTGVDVLSGFSKSKGWASPEWPPYLPSSPPWITTLRSKFTACLCSGDNAWHAFMHCVCWPRGRLCLLVCLSGAHVSLTLFEKKRLGKELLSWSLVSPLPHSCQDACSTESV